MKVNFTHFLVLAFLLSCNKKEQNTSSSAIEHVKVYDAKSILMEDAFEEIKYIPLIATSPEGLVGKVDEILISEDKIFVLDTRVSKAIFCFNIDGSFGYKISNIGNGPGQFFMPFDMDVSDDKLHILDVNQRKVLTYSTQDGSFINEKSFSFQAISFNHVNDDIFLFHLDGREETKENSNLLRFQNLETGSELKTVFNQISSTDYLTVQNEFTKSFDSDFFSKSMNDTIYKIADLNIEPSVYLDFGDRKVPLSVKKMHYMDAHQAIMDKNYFFHLGNFVSNESFIMFNWLGNNMEIIASIYSKNTNQVYNLKHSYEEFFGSNSIYKDYFVSFISLNEFQKKNNKTSLDGNPENPVIMMMKIKAF